MQETHRPGIERVIELAADVETALRPRTNVAYDRRAFAGEQARRVKEGHAQNRSRGNWICRGQAEPVGRDIRQVTDYVRAVVTKFHLTKHDRERRETAQATSFETTGRLFHLKHRIDIGHSEAEV